MNSLTKEALAGRIDHTLLKADASPCQIEALCADALRYGFAAVCVNSVYVPLCAGLLAGSPVKVCTVVGFPLGAASTAVKAFETEQAVRDGAREIDMVIAIGLLKAGRFDDVRRDIAAVVNAAGGACVKVILETCLLTDEEKRVACGLCYEAGAHFVKTSTGFSTAGATTGDIKLMKEAARGLRVKAAGGVRTLSVALAMLEAGADRLGATASLAIVDALQ